MVEETGIPTKPPPNSRSLGPMPQLKFESSSGKRQLAVNGNALDHKTIKVGPHDWQNHETIYGDQ